MPPITIVSSSWRLLKMLVSVLTLWCYPFLFKGWGLKFQEYREHSGHGAGVAFLVGRVWSLFSGSYGMKYESGWAEQDAVQYQCQGCFVLCPV